MGISRIIFENLSMIARIALLPFDSGNGPIRSAEISCHGPEGILWGCSGAFFLCCIALFLWHASHPFTYFLTSVSSAGHQYCHRINSSVLNTPGCPAMGKSCNSFMISCLSLGSGGMYSFPSAYRRLSSSLNR